jgi:hypothetical protein
MRRRAVLALIAGGAVAAVAVPAAPAPAFRALTLPHGPEGRFRGLSALHLDARGEAGLFLSDRGWLFEARVARDGQGAPVDTTIGVAHRLRGTNGHPLPEARSDAEAIAIAPDGSIRIAFEGRDGGRILAYDRPGGTARRVPVPRDFASFPANGGIEAMAAAPDGALFVVPETATGGVFPVWRRRGDWTLAGNLPASRGFRPVAADIGPDGALWVLERRFGPLPLFASRLRRSAADDLMRWETVLETPDGRHGNLEGLSLRAAPGGRIVAAMVSDDNFIAMQRSALVEYTLGA